MDIKAFDELTLEELYDVLALRTDVFVVEQNCPYPEVDGKDTTCYHLLVKEDGKLLAYLRILPKGLSFEEASIGRVVVDKDHRGKGLARPMMEAAIAFIMETLGEETIKISAQAYLEEFYGSVGFEAVSEVYLEDGIPHKDMVYQK